MTDSDAVFEKNLGLLKGGMASDASLENLAGARESEKARVEDSGGPLEFSFLSDDGPKYFHGRRDPAAEAERQLDAWEESENPDWGGMIAVLGFGRMSHLEAALKRIRPGGMLFIADTSPGVLKKFLRHLDLAALRKDGVETRLSVSEAAGFAAREYREALSGRKDFKCSVFTHPNTARIFPEKTRELFKEVAAQGRLEWMNRGTSMFFGKNWLFQAIENLPEILDGVSVGCLKGVFSGRTAVVVGAGPSLSDAMGVIREMSGKCVIFAAGTALRPLLRNGITPDFVVSIDSSPLVMGQYEGVDTPESVRLLSCVTGHPPVLAKFPGRTMFFYTAVADGFAAWLGETGMSLDVVKAGGTVAVSAVDLAAHMGCDRVIMCGVDLAAGKDRSSHVQGSVYTGRRHSDGELSEVPGNNGGRVLTTSLMKVYIDIMGAFISELKRERPVEFHTTALDGARIDGAGYLSVGGMRDILAAEPDMDNDAVVRRAIENGADAPSPDAVRRVIDETLAELEEMKVLSSKAADAYLEAASKKGGNGFSESFLAGLDDLERKIKSGKYGKLLAKNALEMIFKNIYKEMGDVSDVGATLAKSHEFYKAMSEKAVEIREALLKSGLRIKNKTRSLK